ncbi:MAG: transcriptional repressor LexA [Sedimentisphaerales bacterium]|nr:transcriptional repressor LexA [Sedimentisphaerales bacterium]
MPKKRGKFVPVSEQVLTPRQVEILDLISDYRRGRGCSPTMQEMAEALGISKVTVFEHVEALIGKGLLRREANRARSLILTPRARRWRKITGSEVGMAISGDPACFALAGVIAAGQPLEALETTETLNLRDLFAAGEEQKTYALQVRGDSMIEEHIQDGDYVLVQKRNEIRDGQIVVALLENGEATLKKLHRRGKKYQLMGANPSFKPILVNRLAVQGVVVGVIRSCK